MSDPDYDAKLSDEQRAILDRAAYMVILKKREAKAMVEQAGIEEPPEPGWFGSPCGVPGCGCRNYKGDGCPCLNRTTSDPGATPIPHSVCGHRSSQHLRS